MSALASRLRLIRMRAMRRSSAPKIGAAGLGRNYGVCGCAASPNLQEEPSMPEARMLVKRMMHPSAILLLVLGCAEPTAPRTPAPEPNSIIIIGGKLVGVLNAELFAIGNPDIRPGAFGHVQLKIFASGDGGYAIDWVGQFVEGTCDVFLGGGIYGIQDSEDFPNPETLATIDLLRGDNRSCTGKLLTGVSGISGELASLMLEHPDYFIAVFFDTAGGAIAGVLRLAPAS